MMGIFRAEAIVPFIVFAHSFFIRFGKVKFPLCAAPVFVLRARINSARARGATFPSGGARRSARRSGVCRFVREKEPLCHKSHWLRVTLNQLFRLKQRHFKFLHAQLRLSLTLLCSARTQRTKKSAARSTIKVCHTRNWRCERQQNSASAHTMRREVLLSVKMKMKFCADWSSQIKQ